MNMNSLRGMASLMFMPLFVFNVRGVKVLMGLWQFCRYFLEACKFV